MKKKQLQQTTFVPMSQTPFTSRNYSGTVHVQRVHPHASIPHKQYDTDVGFDMELVARCDGRTEDMVNDVTLFDTGLVVKPQEGYYVEIVARSSLHKFGYLLANSVGVIDPEYRGRIMVPLLKFRDGDDIKLPFKGVQMIIRKAEYVYVGEADEDIADEATQRGTGGFGSTSEEQPEGYPGNSRVTFQEKEKVKEKPKKMQNSRRNNGVAFA
jgi:deoxyuridine 5'-triphosphate nucleotidohydrolase